MKKLLWLFPLVAFSQTSVPVTGSAVVPAGTFENPLTFNSPLSRSGNTVSCPTCGGSGSGLSVATPYLFDGANYYLSTNFIPATLPAASAFAWLDQGGATESTYGAGALSLHAPAQSGVNMRVRWQSIGSASTLTVALTCSASMVNYVGCGIGFYESSSGKLETVDFGPWNQPYSVYSGGSYFSIASQPVNPPGYSGSVVAVNGIGVNGWSSATAWANASYGTDAVTPPILFLRLTKSGGNLGFWWSMDGMNYVQLYSEALAHFFSAGPDRWFYFADSQNSNAEVYATLLSWQAQ